MSLSIGRFAKLARVTPRALRHYESLGLITASVRGENKYRYYSQNLLARVVRIRDLQSLGFSLEEVREILKVSEADLISSCARKLAELEDELGTLINRRAHLQEILSSAHRITSNEPINAIERKRFMEAIRAEVLLGLENRCGNITEKHREYLERDLGLYRSSERGEIIDAVKRCVEFARSRQLKLGPGRGSDSASLTLYGLGFISVDPTQYDLIPERLGSTDWNLHIDVEYERGLEFVEFCQKINSSLTHGQIQAFRMPLIDIIEGVHNQLGSAIDYAAIDQESEEVMVHFRTGEIEKIFDFDCSPDTLVARVFADPPEFLGTERISEYLRSQTIYNFRDVMNIVAVWRPSSLAGMSERIERYRQAKIKPFRYKFLTSELQKSLEPNFGLVIYHEDIIRILKAYTPWSFEQCNRFRMEIYRNEPAATDKLLELRKIAPSEVVNLVERESHQAFCLPHAVAFSQFTKQTAVLKSRHREVYFSVIRKFEDKHKLRWDDIGIRVKGVSLLQQ